MQKLGAKPAAISSKVVTFNFKVEIDEIKLIIFFLFSEWLLIY